jgi:hypothetical protein
MVQLLGRSVSQKPGTAAPGSSCVRASGALRAIAGCTGWHPESSYRDDPSVTVVRVAVRNARPPRIPERLTVEEFRSRVLPAGLRRIKHADETPYGE